MPNMTSRVITQWKIQSSLKRLNLQRSFSCLVYPNIYIFKILRTLEESEGGLDCGPLSFISYPTEK